MTCEVVGAFGSVNRLSEALEELYSTGIAPDRVRVATACAPPSSALLGCTERHFAPLSASYSEKKIRRR